MAKKAKKATKKAAPAAKKASPTKKAAKAPAGKAVKKAAKKAAAKPAAPKKAVKAKSSSAAAAPKKAAAKKSKPAVKSPRAVLASKTPPKSARPPKSSKAAKAAAAAEAQARRPAVVRPRKGKDLPLDGIVVLDLTTRLPGRIATQMLANFGADVIKIEPTGPAGGPDHVLGPELNAEDAVYAFLNRGKKSVSLDLKKSAAKDAFLQLVKRADIVFDSARPGEMDSLGLGYKQLKSQNKRIIHVSITGYGQTGPMSKRVGYDLNYMALAGVLDLLSGADGNPLMPGLQLAETAAGALPAVIGTLLALTARDKTGSGQQVDISMYDGLIGVMSAQLAVYSATRRTPQRGKERLFGQFACYNIYPVRNGRWVTVAALEPEYWTALCKAISREDLIEDQYAVGDRQQVLIAELTRIFQKKEVSEWMEFFQGKDVCVTEVRNLGDTLHDEHLIDREMIVQVRPGGGVSYPHVGVFPKLSDTPGALGGDPPGRGQDSVSVLSEAGVSDKKIKDLLKSGALEEHE